MSADPIVARWARPARTRGALADLLTGLPLLVLALVLAWRFAGKGAAIATGLLGALILVGVALRRIRRFDRPWLVKRLDALKAEMEDSAGLLFAADAALNPLQRAQRGRLLRRLSDDLGNDLPPAWPWARIGLAWAVAVPLIALLSWTSPSSPRLAPAREGLPVLPGVPRLVGQRLRIVPPAYTGLPARDEAVLDAKAPVGSRLEWTLRFAPEPRGAELSLAGGGRVALDHGGDRWTAGRPLDRSILYRVIAAGAPPLPAPPLHRLDAIPDAAPRIRVLTPDRSLGLVAPGQRAWSLAFEVRDDYGVAPAAQLRVTVASGDGENVTFRERTMGLRGTGDARRRRFTASLDLAALGFTGTGDLVVQLVAADNRTPGPQVVRSPSLILRWPPRAGSQGSGLDAMARKVLPAYFASERQIIIDAEALIRARGGLDQSHFLARSDGIGADQASLRIRYGQFMGQEDEGEDPASITADSRAAAKPGLPVADDHAASPPASSTFGDPGNVTAEYGHTHDEPEAATLLEPGTRAMLKQALDNMWETEVRLRQGQPAAALPFANKALIFIKRVQQATRIFLARVGTRLPPIDEGRRMTGKRDGLADRGAPLAPLPPGDPAPAATWAALAGRAMVPLGPIEAWLRENRARVADSLALAAAIDAVRREPGCADCRRHLRGLLWALLPRPPAAALRRAPADAAGRRYLDALER